METKHGCRNLPPYYITVLIVKSTWGLFTAKLSAGLLMLPLSPKPWVYTTFEHRRLAGNKQICFQCGTTNLSACSVIVFLGFGFSVTEFHNSPSTDSIEGSPRVDSFWWICIRTGLCDWYCTIICRLFADCYRTKTHSWRALVTPIFLQESVCTYRYSV